MSWCRGLSASSQSWYLCRLRRHMGTLTNSKYGHSRMHFKARGGRFGAAVICHLACSNQCVYIGLCNSQPARLVRSVHQASAYKVGIQSTHLFSPDCAAPGCANVFKPVNRRPVDSFDASCMHKQRNTEHLRSFMRMRPCWLIASCRLYVLLTCHRSNLQACCTFACMQTTYQSRWPCQSRACPALF